MSVFKKLQEARVELQKRNYKKSGKNKFAGYEYFELGDFLPQINEICLDKGLCPVVRFTSDLATLTIHDIDDDPAKPAVLLHFTSPMGSAELKGCHPVQNIGAVETYQRRYLYMAAFEIVEHDALDATTTDKPVTKSTAVPKPEDKTKTDSTYKKFMDSMGTIKTQLATFPDGEAGYYQWLGVYGVQHANEIKDINEGRKLYKDLNKYLAKLKEPDEKEAA